MTSVFERARAAAAIQAEIESKPKVRVHPVTLNQMRMSFRQYQKHRALVEYYHPAFGTKFQPYHQRAIDSLETEFPRFKEEYGLAQQT